MFRHRLLFALGVTDLVIGSCLSISVPAHAQEATTTSNLKTQQSPKAAGAYKASTPARNGSEAETLIVTGTRSVNNRARDATSPVTVLSAATLQRSGQMNLADEITRVDPSITTQTMGNDTNSLTSSIRMRGLNPDEVLVLVDGKRRHTTANIVVDTGPQQGSTPVDLNMIPANAIDHIEILRDGAAALYGSDAIAGVVNIILKKKPQGIHLSTQTGANAYTGDGWNYQVGADGGLSWGHNGYLFLSGQVYHTDHMVVNTHDVRTIPGNAEYGGFNVPQNSNKVASTPEETRENLSIKFGQDLTKDIQGYGLITYAHRHAEGYQNYRLPSVAPTYAPNGFSPIETIEENDYAATLGLKGQNFFGFNWDLSTTYGADEDKLGNKNTINSSLLESTGASPRKVHASTSRLAQWTNNFDMRRQFRIANTVPVLLAFGAEHRLETYNLGAGEYASYAGGGTAAYAGLMPQNAGQWQRDVWAGYVDADFHLLPHWDLDFAGRFEHYTDVNNTENGKISTRYDITRRVALRATISNGFRAPTLAEEHYSALNLSPTGASAVLGADSAAARSLGASRLKPERSTNVEGGIIVEPIKGWHVSADVYQIDIRDRIFGSLAVNGAPALSGINEMGGTVPSSATISDVSANYFANVGSTRTQGLDIQSDYTFRFRTMGRLMLSMGLNLNRTRVNHINTDSFGNPFLNAQNKAYLESAAPRSKIILNAYWTVGKWDINVRQTRYGETVSLLSYQDQTPAGLTCGGQALQYSTTCFNQFKNTPLWTTDLQIGYHVTPMIHVSVGANNIFNVRPRKVPAWNNYLGAYPYDINAAGIGFAGGYYYGRVDATF
ncbi:TonB-dependent siderophore receptor [Komagataeibacter xylinus]|uniref:TonB-dependent receptor n=1 Tax=Komagataeibacter xylinus TaxID=28448 RepID=A0A857FQX1_KOMXY|nr:TonB-dependent receptor [Komagataeibacter xylinus]QHC35597.1 TonB-dependent receptor [Komagataeibacter xylinus]